jgi:hypothetical protein
VVALEGSITCGASEAIAVEVDELPVVPRRVIDRFGVRGGVEGDWSSGGFKDRSGVVEGKRSPRLLIRRQ